MNAPMTTCPDWCTAKAADHAHEVAQGEPRWHHTEVETEAWVLEVIERDGEAPEWFVSMVHGRDFLTTDEVAAMAAAITRTLGAVGRVPEVAPGTDHGPLSLRGAAQALGIGEGRLRDQLVRWGWAYPDAAGNLRAGQCHIEAGHLVEQQVALLDDGLVVRVLVTRKGIEAARLNVASDGITAVGQ